jgi:hypothetical protein
MGKWIDVFPLLEFREGKSVGDQPSSLVEQVIEGPIQEESVAPGFWPGEILTQSSVECGGAVSCHGVVPLRMISEAVEVIDVGEEKLPCDFGRNIRPVHVDFFVLPVVGAQANYVAFLSGNKDQGVLAEKSEDRRIGFSRPVAGLDGESKVLAVAEIETHDGVAYPFDSPIGEEEIGTTNIGKIEGAVAPAICVFGLGSIVAVSDIVQGYAVARGLGPGAPCNICAPLSVVRRLQAQPPYQDYGKTEEGTQGSIAARFCDEKDLCGQVDDDQGNTQRGDTTIHVKRSHRPDIEQKQNEPHDDHSQDATRLPEEVGASRRWSVNLVCFAGSHLGIPLFSPGMAGLSAIAK